MQAILVLLATIAFVALKQMLEFRKAIKAIQYVASEQSLGAVNADIFIPVIIQVSAPSFGALA